MKVDPTPGTTPVLCRMVFQSPCGERVVKGANSDVQDQYQDQFQSPCGERVVKAATSGQAAAANQNVSIPLRGKGCESMYYSQKK